MTKLAYSIEEVAEMTAIGRSRLYAAIREGRLVAHKFGRRTVIRSESLKAFLDSLEQVGATVAA
jgi:excisionase family DNA binding protein